MNNCTTCFSQGWITCLAEALGVDRRDCQLTEAYQRIVGAMLRGVFDCGHCDPRLIDLSEGYSAYDLPCNYIGGRAPSAWPCEKWQPGKDDGDE